MLNSPPLQVKNAFGLAPSPFNYPGPLKRPLSSTAATIVEHGSGALYASLGGSGGSRIFGAVAQVLLNLDWGMNVSAAVEEPRLHDQLFPAMVTLETAFESEFVDALKERGHNVTMFDINLVRWGAIARGWVSLTVDATLDHRALRKVSHSVCARVITALTPITAQSKPLSWTSKVG